MKSKGPSSNFVELPYLSRVLRIPFDERLSLYDFSALFKLSGLAPVCLTPRDTDNHAGEGATLSLHGYDVASLLDKSHAIEVAYLLSYGELPTKAQYETFDKELTRSQMLHEGATRYFVELSRDTHPAALALAIWSSLNQFHPLQMDTGASPQTVAQLLARLPNLCAMAYKYSCGEPFIYPRYDLDFTSNFMQMAFASPAEPFVVNPIASRCLDKYFALIACWAYSELASRIKYVSSSSANPYAKIGAVLMGQLGRPFAGAEVVQHTMQQYSNHNEYSEALRAASKSRKSNEIACFGLIASATQGDLLLSKLERNIAVEAKGSGIAGDKYWNFMEVVEGEVQQKVEQGGLELAVSPALYAGLVLRAAGIPLKLYPIVAIIGSAIGAIACWNQHSRSLQSPNSSRPARSYVDLGCR